MPKRHHRTSADSEITELILRAAKKARRETAGRPEPELTQPVKWPVKCTVGPGLEGAIACESRIGYVHGSKGRLIYCGYDVFDLCTHSTFEEVSFLLLHGRLPTAAELDAYKSKLTLYRSLPSTLRLLMTFPVEEMNSMAALRLGTNLMRYELTVADMESARPRPDDAISADEDSIPMETMPMGEEHAVYEFKRRKPGKKQALSAPSGLEPCYHLVSGVATLAAAIARIREGHMPLEPDPELSHAANFLYMMTGRRPSALEERIMDVALILHADHGMNASTFAAMVVASTLSDFYLSVGSGIAALNGPLHGGANEQVLYMLEGIGHPRNVKAWYRKARRAKRRIVGFGHRVYKAYDPRARILGPLAKFLARENEEAWRLYRTAEALEREVVADLGKSKRIFPNVDFYSGLVYTCVGIAPALFTPIFAVSRVAGWTARILEYLNNNRIFRPRAIYIGNFDLEYQPLAGREHRPPHCRVRVRPASDARSPAHKLT